MNKWNRNYVHAAFLGRDDASVEEVLQVNGLDLKSCNIFWHDARPDYGPWSTDERMENSVYAAMRFLDDYIHPKAVLTDDPSREDDFFVRAVRRKFGEVDAPLVELPTDAAERMRWITRMDSSSLAKWHKTTVNILVQAPLESSGSLIRLIESLKAADYRGFTPPRVTVELASSPDPALERYLHQLHSGSLQMAVRRRIANQKMTAEYASIRFMESFYPSEPSFSYVLVLSPQAEVSPLYFHYLMYNVLEYGYSTYRDPSDRTLLGFSLQLPSTYYNDTTLFYPPTLEHTNTGVRSSVKEEYATPFLWQAPNSDACLYDGSKWAELHSFLTFRLRALHEHKDNPRPLKQISKSYPAWTEFFLEFMQARKYSVLYPPPLDSAALVTVHNDLYQPPEEYLHEPETPPVGEKKDSPRVEMGDVEPFTADPSLPSAYSPHSEPTIARVTLTELLPFAGDLPELHELPHLSFAGQALSSSSSSSSSSLHRQNRNMNPLLEDSDSAADAFRISLGGCTASGLEAERKRKGRRARMKGRGLEARDLFCFEDDELVLDFESGVAAVDGEEEPLTTWPPSATTTTADASTHSHLQSLSSVPLESGA